MEEEIKTTKEEIKEESQPKEDKTKKYIIIINRLKYKYMIK